MSNNQRKFRAPANVKRGKSGAAKITNVSKQAVKLKARMQIEGETPWLKDAMKRAELRAKKYGIKL